MSFLQPEVYYGEYFEVETTIGTEIVPIDVSGVVEQVVDLQEYLEGTPNDKDKIILKIKKGWLGRLTAPGYLDATSWCAYETEDKALEDLRENYGLEVEEE